MSDVLSNRNMQAAAADYAGYQRAAAQNAVNPVLGGIVGGIASGQAVGSINRQAPSEDVIEALRRFNNALNAAAPAGWEVGLTIHEEAVTSLAADGREYQAIRATITKKV